MSFYGPGLKLRRCGHVADVRNRDGLCDPCRNIRRRARWALRHKRERPAAFKGPGVKLRSCGHVGEAYSCASMCKDCSCEDQRVRGLIKRPRRRPDPFSGPGVKMRKCGHVGLAYPNRPECKSCCNVQRAKAYRQNPELAKQRARKWCAEHPEQVRQNAKAWLARNPEKRRVSAMKCRIRRKFVMSKGSVTAQQWLDCLAVWGGCAYCPRTTNLHMDHVMPLVKGGVHDISNVVPACESCNLSKKAKLLSEWHRPTRCYHSTKVAA
jgi:5-methylcytosine-specific restriction endonuclease McrA